MNRWWDHWNVNTILMKFYLLAVRKVVISTTFGSASDENFVQISVSVMWLFRTFDSSCRAGLTNWPLGDLNELFCLGIFKLILVIDGWSISSEIALRWKSENLTEDKSTLVQVMAWCRQATSHYLSQCWPRSQSPYGVTRPQWVNTHLYHYIRWNYWWVNLIQISIHIIMSEAVTILIHLYHYVRFV